MNKNILLDQVIKALMSERGRISVQGKSLNASQIWEVVDSVLSGREATPSLQSRHLRVLSRIIESKLHEFGVNGEVSAIYVNDTTYLFQFKSDKNSDRSILKKLSPFLSIATASPRVQIVESSNDLIGVEVGR